MTHANDGPKDLGSWEAQLAAKEEALKKREATVAAAESRLGVRACMSMHAALQARQCPCMHAMSYSRVSDIKIACFRLGCWRTSMLISACMSPAPHLAIDRTHGKTCMSTLCRPRHDLLVHALTAADRACAAHQHKNWPRCRPLLRHAIGEDVPEQRRGLVRRGYTAWVLAAAGFGANWLTITMMCALTL